MNMKDAVVVVTGANRGLGRELARESLARGAKRVYATARKRESLDSLVKENPGAIVPLVLDVTDERSLAAAAEVASDATVLVNNAGLLGSYGVLSSTLSSIREDFEVNTFGLLAATRAFAPALERAAKKGPKSAAVVNILSVVSLGNLPGLGGYSASKAAAWSLSQALRYELGKKGIDVIAAFPGGIDTDMVRAMEMPKTRPEVLAANLFAAIAKGELDVAPDATSEDVYAEFARNPRAVERRFFTMAG